MLWPMSVAGLFLICLPAWGGPPTPPRYTLTPAETAALERARQDAAGLSLAEREALKGALRRIVNAGQAGAIPDADKRAMMDSLYLWASDDAGREGVPPQERKRLLRDWVILLDEMDIRVYGLRPTRDRYLIGRDVGAVGRNTPVEPRSAPGATPAPATPGPAAPGGERPAPRGEQTPPIVPPDMPVGTLAAPGGDGSLVASPPPFSAEENAVPEAASRAMDLKGASSALGRGAGDAAALADGTRSAESLPGGAARAAPGSAHRPPGAGQAPGASSPSGGGDLSRPGTPGELALAAGPYRPAFESAGLRPGWANGAPALLRRDGTPASAQETAALSADIARMPAAAARAPGYLDPRAGGISWENFQSLKRDYSAKPELRGSEFKHIALSGDERDFQRSESCDKVSGACNPHARASYKRGEDVPAEELRSIWDKINSVLGGAASPAAPRRMKTRGIWSRLARFFGGGGEEDDGAAAADGTRARESGAAGSIAAPGSSGAAPGAGVASGPVAEGFAVPRRYSPLLAVLFAVGVVLAAVPLMRSRWLKDRP